MLILASGSPRRKELLQQIGVKFKVIVPEVKEYSAEEISNPLELVKANSAKKAEAVCAMYPEDAVVSADTVVALDGKIYGKPKDEAEAYKFLRELAGKKHQVYTGITYGSKGRLYTEAGITQVAMCELTDEEINDYIKTGEPMDKAGAYGIQGMAAKFIKGIEGCYFNVVGLPLNLFYELQKKVDDNHESCEVAGFAGGGKA